MQTLLGSHEEVLRFVSWILVFTLILTGCAVKAKKLDTQKVREISSSLRTRAYANQEPVGDSITLYQAMARALKYNLDVQIELMEEALRAREFDVARAEMLPNFVANASYRGRNNDTGGESINLDTRDRVGGNPTTGTPRNQLAADIELSWDILDFGVSYVRARQASNERLIAEERKRKVANRILEDVRTAYWRAVAAERLSSGLKSLARRTQKALTEARKLEKSGQASPLAALTFQRELIDIKSEIQNLEDNISIARTQLSALMNLPPGTRFKLKFGKRTAAGLQVNQSVDEMIDAAVVNRTELREIAYQLRNNKLERDKALLEILPSLRVFLGGNVDANTLLFNQNWIGWGSAATANLMNAFRLPTKRKAIDAQRNLLDRRGLALTVAIITQVHVSNARFKFAKRKFSTALERVQVQTKIRKQVKAAVDAGTASNQTLIREEMNTLVSRARRDIAYADMQNSFANIYASIGVDPFERGIDRRQGVDVIADQLSTFWRERGDLGAAIRAKRAERVQGVQTKLGKSKLKRVSAVNERTKPSV